MRLDTVHLRVFSHKAEFYDSDLTLTRIEMRAHMLMSPPARPTSIRQNTVHINTNFFKNFVALRSGMIVADEVHPRRDYC